MASESRAGPPGAQDTAASRDGARGVGELLRELANGGAALVRQEVELARQEGKELVRAAGVGTAWAGLGAVLALLGALALCTGVILLAGDQWLRGHFWLAALIVTVLAAVAAGILARVGMRALEPSNLVPDQTVESLKEDRAWLKRQLTSGATSS